MGLVGREIVDDHIPISDEARAAPQYRPNLFVGSSLGQEQKESRHLDLAGSQNPAPDWSLKFGLLFRRQLSGIVLMPTRRFHIVQATRGAQ